MRRVQATETRPHWRHRKAAEKSIHFTNGAKIMKFKNIYHGLRIENHLIEQVNTAYIECLFVNCAKRTTFTGAEWKPGDKQSVVAHCLFNDSGTFDPSRPATFRPLTPEESDLLGPAESHNINTNVPAVDVVPQ